MDRDDFDSLLNKFVQISYDLQCLLQCQSVLERNETEGEIPLHISNIVLKNCIERIDDATDQLDSGIRGLVKAGSL
jgi:hypothetical protein